MKSFALGCLALAASASLGRADTLTVNAFNDNTPATVTFNDGAGHSGTINVDLTQFNVTNAGSGGSVTFSTFSIDLLHSAGIGQSYSATPRSDLATAFTNGSGIAYVYQTFGLQNLTNNPDQAAAVQIALWDLSLNNHTPVSLVLDSDGTYSSGDQNVFSVSLGSNADAPQIASLANEYLVAASGATHQGGWLDASASGGESFLQPTPEPSSFLLSITAAGSLSIWGLRRWYRRSRRRRFATTVRFGVFPVCE
jgi:hypothetical protein